MPVISGIPPLPFGMPIVDPATGAASREFSQWWQQFIGNAATINTGVDANTAAIVGKADKSTQVIAGAGLSGGGALSGNVTLSADEQAILDAIGSTRGSVLYRGASGWAALGPGTSGNFLKTNGAGADPTWAAASGGGGGSLTLISRVVTSSSAPDVTFSAIPSTYEDLVVRVSGRASSAATESQLFLQFNGDTAGHYDWTKTAAYQNTLAGSSGFASTAMAILGMSANSGPTGVASAINILIPAYARTTFHKVAIGDSTERKTDTAGSFNIVRWVGNGDWRSTAAINQIKIYTDANWIDGSVVSLFGIS